MVTSFSTAENKYNFEIDGKPYFLRRIAFGETALIEQIADTPPQQIPNLARDLIAQFGDKRTSEAVGTLSISQVGQLFREWAGLTPGESSSSADSSETAEQN